MPETSVPPEPPKSHGGGAFIGAVIVMLLAMGGLLYWKFKGSSTPPAPVAVKVGAQGNTCGASLASDTLGDGAVASCVLQKFRSGTFPAPIGGCVDVQVLINFTPKTGK